MRVTTQFIGRAVCLSVALTGCASGEEDVAPEPMTFEEFAASVPREQDTGAYIVQGDIPVWSKDALRKVYDAERGPTHPVGDPSESGGDADIDVQRGSLALLTVGGVESIWPSQINDNLTFCVSDSFGANKTAVVNAMLSATAAWSASGAVTFVRDSSQEGTSTCTATNNNVVFDVRPTSGQSYLARAFFPSDPRAARNILINTSAFSLPAGKTLTGVLRHEVGHTLGFRHEQTVGSNINFQPACYEDTNWLAVTSYDQASAMHYDWCNGTATDNQLSAKDRKGVACTYGDVPGAFTECRYHGIVYQPNVTGIGYLPTVRAGNTAGTLYHARSLLKFWAIMQDMPSSVGICYSSYVTELGWRPEVCDGAEAGADGHSISAMRVRLINAPAGCGVSYQAHLMRQGWRPDEWQGVVTNNAVAGVGGRYMDAIKVTTTGPCQSD